MILQTLPETILDIEAMTIFTGQTIIHIIQTIKHGVVQVEGLVHRRIVHQADHTAAHHIAIVRLREVIVHHHGVIAPHHAATAVQAVPIQVQVEGKT